MVDFAALLSGQANRLGTISRFTSTWESRSRLSKLRVTKYWKQTGLESKPRVSPVRLKFKKTRSVPSQLMGKSASQAWVELKMAISVSVRKMQLVKTGPWIPVTRSFDTLTASKASTQRPRLELRKSGLSPSLSTLASPLIAKSTVS